MVQIEEGMTTIPNFNFEEDFLPVTRLD